MPTQKETPEQITQWLAEEWGRSFASVVESMSDQRPHCACDGTSKPYAPLDASLNSEQEFNLGPQYLLRLSVPELVWRDVGARVLRAAGIEEVGYEDAQSTFLEILSQTNAAFAQALSTRLGHEVTCASRSDKESLPADSSGLSLSVTLLGADIADYPVFVSPARELVEMLASAEETGAAAVANSQPETSAQPSSISKTFDLLLGVHLPVSVSFGKTNMMVKEVLKLTTGSIVELNRAVTEPVDIIVNNCVIARGEVVVVAGNYGVRVREIASKEQRYETGIRSAAAAHR